MVEELSADQTRELWVHDLQAEDGQVNTMVLDGEAPPGQSRPCRMESKANLNVRDMLEWADRPCLGLMLGSSVVVWAEHAA